jgi:hypothetical protein
MNPPQVAADADPTRDATPPIEPECECEDVERCPVHYGYD